MANSKSRDVRVWVKDEIFRFGIISSSAHPKLNFKNLKKIISYSRTKYKELFPLLRCSDWKYICSNKLQINDAYATMLSATFEKFSSIKMSSYDKKLNIFEFLIFLMIQRIKKLDSCEKLINSQEKWPNLADLSECSGISFHLPQCEEESIQLSFIRSCLKDIIDLINDEDFEFISMDVIKSFDILFEGQIGDMSSPVEPISKIILDVEIAQHIKFNPKKACCSYNIFLDWMLKSLTLYPYGLTQLKKNRSLLSWIDKSLVRNGGLSPTGRILTNANYSTRDHKLILMSKVCNTTLARRSKTLFNSSLIISRCRNSYLYFLSMLRSCNVSNCYDTTIVMGPNKLAISVNNCYNCLFIVSCQQIIISNCTGCTFHLLVSTNPILKGDKNSDIIFAPYNTSYPYLKDDLDICCINFDHNLWNQPVHLTTDGPVNKSEAWILMASSDFYIHEIPFSFKESSQSKKFEENDLNLPSEYRKSLQSREETLNSWHKLVNERNLNEVQRTELYSKVSSHFLKWLKESGHQMEIDSLNNK